MPLTLLAGLYGMNVQLPHLPGGDAAQFWWICGICLGVIVAMLGGVPPEALDLKRMTTINAETAETAERACSASSAVLR